jgi:hypothetical protein
MTKKLNNNQFQLYSNRSKQQTNASLLKQTFDVTTSRKMGRQTLTDSVHHVNLDIELQFNNCSALQAYQKISFFYPGHR